jgi:hypothetical protein
MEAIGLIAIPFAVVFGILSFYWWFNYIVLERAAQKIMSSNMEHNDGGCLTPVLLVIALLTLLILMCSAVGS